MRIAVAQDALHAEGGVESYLAAIIPALRARGHSVAMLFVRRDRGARLVQGVDGPLLAADESTMDSAIAQLRGWRPDVCFSNNMVLLDLERRMLDEWPVVKFMHGYAGTCVSGLKMHAFPVRAACSRTFGPSCLALYAPRRCGAMSPGALARGYRWSRQQQRLFRRYDAVVVASQHMIEEYTRNGVPSDRIALAPLFASPGPRPAAHAASDTVLFLGRMTHLKGGDLLIRATARASRRLGRSISLVMGGDGPQRNAWERLASAEGADARFTGWLDAEARALELARATLLAVPSVWPEPFGLVGLEAAGAGVPAVAFDTGGVRQWLRHDVTGLLAPASGGVASLADALARVLDDDGLRSRLGSGAAAAAAEMSCDAHLDALEGLLMRAAARAAAAGGAIEASR